MTANSECVKSAIFEKCSVVLVDVLGTTTSIDFAKETLFPFATKNATETLKAQWESDDLKEALKTIKKDDTELDVEAAAKLVSELTEAGSEAPGLKTIQGMIYQKGYESGNLKSHVFDDVPTAFELWAKSKKVCVYSTGSKDSQKQLFSHSIKGDLTAHITEYFDQSVGPKTEADSYKKIVAELSVKPDEVLFISDQVAEVKAALEAGLSSIVVTREGNAKLEEADVKDLTVVSSFAEVNFENTQKRKIDDEEPQVATEEPPSKMAKTESEPEVEKETVEKKETVEAEEAMEVDNAKTEIKTVEEPKTEVAEEKKPEEAKQTEDEMEVDTKTEEKKDENKVDSTSNECKEEPSPKEEKTEKTDEAVTEKEETSEAKPTEEVPKTEKKEEEKKVEPEVAKVESSEVTTSSDKVEAVSETVAEPEAKVEEPKKEEEKEVKGEEPTKVEEVKAEESTKVDEAKAEKMEEPKVEETPAKKPDLTEKKPEEEEKENKKDLANGLENGEETAAAACVLNGEASTDKVNGDSSDTAEEKQTNGTIEPEEKPKSVEPATETVEEAKAKKVEPETAPGVAVEA